MRINKTTPNFADFSAYILAAGAGTRMYPFTKHITKPLLPILNKPILFHTIESVSKAGIKKIGIIIPKNDTKIVKHVSIEYPDHEIEYIDQKAPRGTGDAVLQIKPYLKTPYFLVIAGDSLFPVEYMIKISQIHKDENNSITLALEKMPYEKMQYCSTVDYRSGRVWEIREKPATQEEILSEFNSAALYVFTDEIFNALNKTEKSIRDEYELATAINIVIQQKKRVGGSIVNKVCHISNVYDLWKINLELLKNTRKKDHKGNLIGTRVKLHGKVRIHNSIVGDNSTILEGVSIKNTLILPNSIVKRNFTNSVVLSDYSKTFSEI